MGNCEGERELLDRAVKALEAELATKTCNKQITSKLENAELARDSEKTCNNKQVSCKLVASEDAISRKAVDTLVDELARAISDERCCMSKGRSTATIMQDILDLPSVMPKQMAIDAIGRDKGRCNWCSNISKRHFRIEYYWIDDDGNAASFNTKNGREVATGIAKFCPSCGRKLNIAER